MSAAIIAAAVIVAAAGAATARIEADRKEKAQRQAEQRAFEDQNKRDIEARKAAVFSETEGQGQGDIGTVNTEVDKSVGLGLRTDTKHFTL